MKKLIVLLLMLSFAGHAGLVDKKHLTEVFTNVSRAGIDKVKQMLSDMVTSAPNSAIKLVEKEESVDLVVTKDEDVNFILRFREAPRKENEQSRGVTVSVEKGTSFKGDTREDLLQLCRNFSKTPVISIVTGLPTVSSYCPRLRANITPYFTDSPGLIHVAFSGRSIHAPTDFYYGVRFLLSEAGPEGAAPIWSISAWYADDDADDGHYFYYSSNQ